MSSTALPVIIILGMPIYEYRCPDGHRFEVFQSMADDPVSKCEVCGKPVERVFHPIAVHFKGSGFYTTDYARKGASKATADGDGKESGAKNGDSKSSESKSSDSKSEKPKTSTSSPD
jgi:putative FmdB family regulatory protein